ncbi:hypothetical protein ABZZ16_39955 [Streptomyces sp. NPDC006386]|uniref:hypothetical protein n=1 Tax=Streptomyces sp. NPDC006386 TaxID=3156762 RepID=UPI0033B1CCE4
MGPEGFSGSSSAGFRVFSGAGFSDVPGLSEVFGVFGVSGDGSGSGSSKAGRAWCQGASELRGVRGAPTDWLSRRLSEPLSLSLSPWSDAPR